MTITRENIEVILIFRRGPAMLYMNLDGTTKDGTNVDLSPVIATAIEALGGTYSDLALVTDGDVATVEEAKQKGLFDVSEYYLLRGLRGRFTEVDEVSGPFAAKLSQLGKMWKEDLDELAKKIADEWGVGVLEAEAGNITQSFAAHGTDSEPLSEA